MLSLQEILDWIDPLFERAKKYWESELKISEEHYIRLVYYKDNNTFDSYLDVPKTAYLLNERTKEEVIKIVKANFT